MMNRVYPFAQKYAAYETLSLAEENNVEIVFFSRFSLMLVTQWDGCLSCWDLLRRRSAPIVTAQLCDEPLLRLRPHEGVSMHMPSKHYFSINVTVSN